MNILRTTLRTTTTSKCGKEWGFTGVGKDYQSVRSVAIMLQLRLGFRNAGFKSDIAGIMNECPHPSATSI